MKINKICSKILVVLLTLSMTMPTLGIVYAAEVGQPVIVSTSPLNGATDVSPIDLEVRVDFDRNMDTSTLANSFVAVTGTLANGVALNSDIKKNVVCDVANPTYVRVILYGIRMSLGSNIKVKFTGLKSAGGAVKDTFNVDFSITTNFPATNVNQINNSGFEDTKQVVAGNANTYDTTLVHSGATALKVVQAGAYASITMPAYYQPNKKYYYSAWVRLDPNTNIGDSTSILVNPSYNYNSGTAATPLWTLVNTPVAVSGITRDTPYTQIKGIFTPPASKVADMNNSGQLQNMRFNIYANPITGGTQTFTFYVDDLELREFENISLVSSIPANGATTFPISTRELVFNFNTIIDETSLSENIKIDNSTSFIQSIVVNPESKTQVIVTLNSDLTLETMYNISITGIKDIYGQLFPNYEYAFKTAPKFEFSECQLLNSDFNQISTIAEGIVQVSINNLQSFSPESVNLTVVACLYKDGFMKDINFNSVTINGNSTYPGSVRVPITIPNVSDGEYELRVFRVDSFENLQLYYDNAVIYGE